MSKTQASKIVGWAMARQTSIHAIIGVFMVLGLCIFAFVAVYAPRAPGDEPLASIVMGTLFAVIFLGVRPFLKALYWYARPQALPLYQLIHERPQDIVRVGETRREVEVHQSAGGGVVA
ncbi:MAG TPA: hypothetical protein DCL54_01555, partial [Alphaproteobacteria bacterium]|nr:hypothetical protein [Alphaproteobacteria bacterium]